VKSYKDLEIYQISYDLAVKIHKLSLKLPNFEQYEEGRQIRKSSKGITSCIVEGYGRKKYKADFIKFLIYSRASCDETIVHLSFIRDTHKLDNKEVGYYLEKYKEIAMSDWEPKIAAFLCNWCSYGAADLAGVSRMEYPANIRVIRIPCTGRMDPKFFLAALREGADGVWVSG